MIEASTDSLLDRLELMADGIEEANEIIAELRRRLAIEEEFIVPVAVVEAMKKSMPFAGKKTWDAVTRRCRFCYRVWKDKYGPWNLEQAQYAESVLVWCIGQAEGRQFGKLYAAFQRVLNHEDVHAGFLRRAGEVPAEQKVDVHLEVMEALR